MNSVASEIASVPLTVPTGATVAIVIPCYKVRKHILKVISEIGVYAKHIYVIDDQCPENTGRYVEDNCKDSRVKVLYNPVNLGVGGATMNGFRQALRDRCDIVVKLDGDDQMDPRLITSLIKPLELGTADYVKGNRFFSLENLEKMPFPRIFGNTVLSFVSKAASGYWNVMDPTNGFVAIHASALSLLSLDKIDKRYFFESDMLFRLNTIRAVVQEMPMKARYGDEESNLRINKVILEFPLKYFERFLKRLFYNYILRDFNVCSIEIIFGSLLLTFGLLFGAFNWYHSIRFQSGAATGTIMLAVLPIIIGVQLLLEAVTLDVLNVPKRPLQESYDWKAEEA